MIGPLAVPEAIGEIQQIMVNKELAPALCLSQSPILGQSPRIALLDVLVLQSKFFR